MLFFFIWKHWQISDQCLKKWKKKEMDSNHKYFYKTKNKMAKKNLTRTGNNSHSCTRPRPKRLIRNAFLPHINLSLVSGKHKMFVFICIIWCKERLFSFKHQKENERTWKFLVFVVIVVVVVILSFCLF